MRQNPQSRNREFHRPVFCNSRHCGDLEITGDRGSLVYRKEWLKRGESIDPVNFPLTDKSIVFRINQGNALLDATPDTWGRAVYVACGIDYPNRLDYIRHASPYGTGALTLDAESPNPTGKSDLEKLRQIFARLESGREIRDKDFLKNRARSCQIGGARPKCSYTDNGVQYICKFGSVKDAWDELGVESATTKLASLCGVKAIKQEIMTLSNDKALISRRFDRKDGLCLNVMSAFSVLGLYEGYDIGHPANDYRCLAENIKKYGDRADLLELFKRMVFNCVIGNIDDHAKNHAFFVEKGKIWLAPAYDLTIPDWPGVPREASMRIGKAEYSMTLENLLSAAPAFDLTEDEAKSIYKQTYDIVKKAWAGIYADNTDRTTFEKVKLNLWG